MSAQGIAAVLPRQVPSQEAEAAVTRVNRTYALGVDIGARQSAPVSRLGGTRGVLLEDPRHHLLLPHLTAIAEEFSRNLLIVVSAPLVPVTHPLMHHLWVDAELQAEGHWAGHTDAWRKWHGVRLTDCIEYHPLMAFVEARNAIMHGLGQFTRKQRRKDGGKSVTEQLKRIGLTVSGLKISLPPAAARRCADTSIGFILWLDLQVQSRGLL